MQQARGESSGTGDCVAALVYVYDHTVRELAKSSCEAHHHHHDLSVAAIRFISTIPAAWKSHCCAEKTSEVHHFAEHVIAERGVRHGRLVAVPVEVKEETHPHGNDRAKKHPTSTSGTPDGWRADWHVLVDH